MDCESQTSNTAASCDFSLASREAETVQMEKAKKEITPERFRKVHEAMRYYRAVSVQQMKDCCELSELTTAKISHLEKQLATVSSGLSSKDEELARLSLDLSKKDEELQALRSYIARSNVIFEELEVVGEGARQPSQLSSEITDLKRALEASEDEVASLKLTIADSVTEFQTLWRRRKKEAEASREALCASHQVEMTRLHEHIAFAKNLLEFQRKKAESTKMQLDAEQEGLKETILSCHKALADWEQRWANRELEVAAQLTQLKEQHQAQLAVLLREKQEASTTAIKDKLTLTEQNLNNQNKLSKMELQLLQSEAQWRKKVEALEEQLKTELEQAREAKHSWTSRQEEWLESQRRTKVDIQVLVDRIVHLTHFASKTDRQKAAIKRAEDQAWQKACKRRCEDKKEKERSLNI